MRDYEDEILDYEIDAESRYDDFNGDYDEDYFDTGFEGNEDFQEMEYIDVSRMRSGMYDNYTTTSIGKIDPNDRTLTVVVANASGAAAQAILFGGNEEAAQPAGVTVTVEESSHKEVREESKANPFKIRGMKLSVSNPLQFDNILKIVKRTAAGSNTERVYQPRNATSPQNFTQSLIDDNNFEMDVTGQDSLRVIVKDGVTMVFTFTIKARANMGNLLKGNNVAELSDAPRTTGLPQIDLLRKQNTGAFGVRPAVRQVVRPIRSGAPRTTVVKRPAMRLVRRR
ncbi:MAG: hypothetical protein CMD31_13110 [Flavobacteriales bacterium]|nr:hypothetical protein [Flavobacteriales bacterium]|tara:strand:- start:41386 stop:42234 length:849 start_codon:yes stop_codon:yes gene_type:complete